jgi:hypothetical protein
VHIERKAPRASICARVLNGDRETVHTTGKPLETRSNAIEALTESLETLLEERNRGPVSNVREAPRMIKVTGLLGFNLTVDRSRTCRVRKK